MTGGLHASEVGIVEAALAHVWDIFDEHRDYHRKNGLGQYAQLEQQTNHAVCAWCGWCDGSCES